MPSTSRGPYLSGPVMPTPNQVKPSPFPGGAYPGSAYLQPPRFVFPNPPTQSSEVEEGELIVDGEEPPPPYEEKQATIEEIVQLAEDAGLLTDEVFVDPAAAAEPMEEVGGEGELEEIQDGRELRRELQVNLGFGDNNIQEARPNVPNIEIDQLIAGLEQEAVAIDMRVRLEARMYEKYHTYLDKVSLIWNLSEQNESVGDGSFSTCSFSKSTKLFQLINWRLINGIYSAAHECKLSMQHFLKLYEMKNVVWEGVEKVKKGGATQSGKITERVYWKVKSPYWTVALSNGFCKGWVPLKHYDFEYIMQYGDGIIDKCSQPVENI